MPRTKETVQGLERQVEQLRAQIARKRALARNAERKTLTHRKIVLGAFVLAYAGNEKGDLDLAKLSPDLRTRLDRFVSRPHDRAVIGLPPRSATSQTIPK